MKDRIQNFLARCGGHASSLAIASTVLHLRNATPAIAERVVSALLNADTRFSSDGLGNWYLAENSGASEELAPQKICVAFTPMRAAQMAKANRIVLCWSLSPFDATSFFEIVLRGDGTQAEERSGLPECSREEFSQNHLKEFQACVLLAWNPAAVRAALRRITANAAEAWLPATNISLQNLARNLLRLNQKPKLHQVYERLTGSSLRSESWEHQLRAQIEIWEALQPHCEEHGLRDPQPIAHYSRRALPPDFSEYAFDEKLVASLPETPGVYVMKDREERVIYVGKAANLRERVRSYFANDFASEVKLKEIRTRIVALHYEIFDTELDALLREQTLIKRFRPSLNRQIAVHSRVAIKFKNMQGIYLAPLHASPPARLKGRVVVYFLSPQNLNRLTVNLARVPKRRIRKAIELHLQQIAQAETPEAAQQTQFEIAARWFHHNRDGISAIATHVDDDTEEIENRLLCLLQTPEIFHERVELA